MSAEHVGVVGSGGAMCLASAYKARLFLQRAGCNNLHPRQLRQQSSLTICILTHTGVCNVIQIQGRGRVVNISFFILPAIDLGKDFGTR